MRSSTSNSERHRSASGPLRAGLVVFVLCLAALASWGYWVRLNRADWMVPAPAQVDWDQVMVSDAFGRSYEDNIFYYGIGPAMGHARQADVILLGNSRPLFAFRSGALEAFAKRSGLKVYNLCGLGSTVGYATALIEKQDLHPRYVVLNEDNFFNPVLWPGQKTAMDQGAWSSWMEVGEHDLSLRAQSILQRWIPRLIFFKEHEGKIFHLARSVADGGLLEENLGSTSIPLEPEKGFRPSRIDPDYLGRARQFQKLLKGRGIELILTHVPSSVENESYARLLAKELGVPYIEPQLTGLATFDGSHLNPASADRFADDFFSQFLRSLPRK